METRIATSLPPDELEAPDRLQRDQGVSRGEAIREAVRWYARWSERLPFEDPIANEIEP